MCECHPEEGCSLQQGSRGEGGEEEQLEEWWEAWKDKRGEDRKKGKGKPGERANVLGQIILVNIVPASQPRKFILRAILNIGHSLTLDLTRLGKGKVGNGNAWSPHHADNLWKCQFVYRGKIFWKDFFIFIVFIMISAVSHLNSKLRFTLFEMFHFRKMEQNHKKEIRLTIVKFKYSGFSCWIFKLKSHRGQREK